MPNRQLVEYIKGQVALGVNDANIRQVLVEQGWADKDISQAFSAARGGGSGVSPPKKGVVITILVVLVLLLGILLFFVVFSNTPSTPQEPNNDVPIAPPPQQISGLAACERITYSMDKHECYVLVHQESEVDCRVIKDNIEQGFCFGALEEVLITRYMDERA